MNAPEHQRDAADLSAYLDGELGADDQARIETALRSSPGLRALLDDLRRVRDGLAALPRASAPPDLAAGVARAEPVTGVPRAARQRGVPRLQLLAIRWLASAAVLALIAFAGWRFFTPPTVEPAPAVRRVAVDAKNDAAENSERLSDDPRYANVPPDQLRQLQALGYLGDDAAFELPESLTRNEPTVAVVTPHAYKSSEPADAIAAGVPITATGRDVAPTEPDNTEAADRPIALMTIEVAPADEQQYRDVMLALSGWTSAERDEKAVRGALRAAVETTSERQAGQVVREGDRGRRDEAPASEPQSTEHVQQIQASAGQAAELIDALRRAAPGGVSIVDGTAAAVVAESEIVRRLDPAGPGLAGGGESQDAALRAAETKDKSQPAAAESKKRETAASEAPAEPRQPTTQPPEAGKSREAVSGPEDRRRAVTAGGRFGGEGGGAAAGGAEDQPTKQAVPSTKQPPSPAVRSGVNQAPASALAATQPLPEAEHGEAGRRVHHGETAWIRVRVLPPRARASQPAVP